MLKVLFLQPYSDDGVTHYRLDNFKRAAARLGLANCQYIDTSLDEKTLRQVIQAADVYVCRLNEALLFLFDELSIQNIKKPIIVDIDDNYECVDPLSNMYEHLGTREVKLPSGEWLWQDGKSNFDIAKNNERLLTYARVLKEATAVITTTFELKAYAERYNKNVVVIPNAIDPELFPALNLQPKKEINLLWAGGSSHFPDLIEIKPAIKELMESYPHLHFYLLGQVFQGVIKDLPENRVHTKGWIKADGHGYRLASIDADIAIAPLKDMEFNTYKSSIKYYEYSAIRVATVAKDMPPYSEDIQDGKTGLLYKDTKDFKHKIEELIKDPILRLQLAQGAYEYVLNKRDVNKVVKDWVEFLSEVSKVYENTTIQS